jgi:hypothetical protein
MRLSSRGTSIPLVLCGLILSGCSAAPDDQAQLGAKASFATFQTPTQPHNTAGACPPQKVSAATPGPSQVQSQAQALRTIYYRCAQLRQDGEIWQKSRNLAVKNRGEAGARMADLHTPWTKENAEFFVDECGPRQQKTRTQAMSRIGRKPAAPVCG